MNYILVGKKEKEKKEEAGGLLETSNNTYAQLTSAPRDVGIVGPIYRNMLKFYSHRLI